MNYLEFKEENKERIRGLVERITKFSIGQQNPEYLCFSTCFVLSIYLDIQDYFNNIKGGKMEKADMGKS